MIEHPTARLLVHWAPVIMLVLAFGSWPYGYFMLLVPSALAIFRIRLDTDG